MTVLGRWMGFLGDLSLWGWLITFLYAVTAVVAWRRGRLLRGGGPPEIHRFWAVLAVFLVLLGVNKQLDFQTLFFLGARQLDYLVGVWMHSRRPGRSFLVELLTLLGLVIGSAAALALLFRTYWKHRRTMAWELSGVLVLAAFTLLRAGTFFHLFWRWEGSFLLRHAHILELAGQILLLVAALRPPSPPRGLREPSSGSGAP